VTQALVSILFTGSAYALFALGYALTFGVTGSFNLAHPAVFTIGALVAVVLVKSGHPLWVAAAYGTVAGGLSGIAIDRVAFWLLRRKGTGPPAQLISGVAALALCSGLLLARFGTVPATFPAASIRMTGLRLGTTTVSGLEGAAIATCVAAFICVQYLLRSTRYGLAVRAIAGNPVAAQASGVSIETIVAQTMFIASALGALSGIAFGAVTVGATSAVPMFIQLSVLAAVVLGGLGSLPGTVAAAYGIALIQTAAEFAMPAGGRDLASFAVVLIAIAFFPRGILSQRALRSA
jgi:branched-chain amino acid transport system permease protein